MDLSVVVAATDASCSIEACIRALDRSCSGLSYELLVVDASSDGTAQLASAVAAEVIVVRMPPGTLTPRLWSEGYWRARGRVIAFTTAHCIATAAWARALMAAIDAGAAGAGGPLVVAPEAGPLDRAVFALRYSTFTRQALGAGRTDGEIAGDNAAYDRRWLDRHADTFGDGFWEVDFHRLVRSGGGWLMAVPEAAMSFGRSFPASTIIRHRFAHGTHCGAGRVNRGACAAWQIVAASPLVPALLAARAAARLNPDGADRWRFAVSLPWMLTIGAAWAAGEAWGAMFGARLQAGASGNRGSA